MDGILWEVQVLSVSKITQQFFLSMHFLLSWNFEMSCQIVTYQYWVYNAYILSPFSMMSQTQKVWKRL